MVLSSFITFLGEFFPRTAVEPELDYIVKIMNGDIAGWWICQHCRSTDKDIEVMSFHMRHDHATEKCRFCDEHFTCMFSMDIHYQEMHGNLIAIDCKLWGTLLPNSAALKTHLEWHHSANRSSIAHEYAELCQKCGKFFPRGFEIQSHRAFCMIQQAPEQGNSAHRGDATA